MKSLIAITGLLSAPAFAATISFNYPAVVSGPFTVTVQASNLFAGRTGTDAILSYGFNVATMNLTFTGATSGPLFDAATTEPGTNVFGAASGLGIFPPTSGSVTLAALRFTPNGLGPPSIAISSDLTNAFQGLQFLNRPFAESISGTLSISAVPEPATLGHGALALAAWALLLTVRRRTGSWKSDRV